MKRQISLAILVAIMALQSTDLLAFRSARKHSPAKNSKTHEGSNAGVLRHVRPAYFQCSKKAIQSLMEINRMAQEYVLGKGGKGNEVFAETFASDRLVDSPEIMNEVTSLFPKGNPMGKALGIFVQPWGKVHVLRVVFESKPPEKKEIALRSTPGETFGSFKGISIDYNVEQSRGMYERGELCRKEISSLGVRNLRPTASAPTFKPKIVKEADLERERLTAGVEIGSQGPMVSQVSRVTVEARNMAEGENGRYVNSRNTYTLKDTPIPATTASLNSELRMNVAEEGHSSLASSNAKISTDLTSEIKTHVTGGYTMVEGAITGVQSGAASELQIDDETRLTVSAARTSQPDTERSEDTLGLGVTRGAVHLQGSYSEKSDDVGAAEARRVGANAQLKVGPRTLVGLGVAEAEELRKGDTLTQLNASVSHTLENSGNLNITGSKSLETNESTLSLGVKLPWPGDTRAEKSLPSKPAGPQLPGRRKQIVRDPRSGEWVYVIRLYDERGDQRGEIFTGESAPDPATLLSIENKPES